VFPRRRLGFCGARAATAARYADPAARPEVAEELEAQLEMGFKVELEAFGAFGATYLADEWLPAAVGQRDFLM
jgi:DNA topoisomerase VI subunit A